MCCFSREVTAVSATRIFARRISDERQAIVYSMTLDTPGDVAMILPIPVAAGSGEHAVQFISLEKYPEFFEALTRCFDDPKPMLSRAQGYSKGDNAAPLKVEQVGSFNASFVPTIRDFRRLDAQFRLPDGVWEKLGEYARYGFAVFKLRKGAATVHPMAFTFPTALPGKLFFPTVHIHDGKVHEKAEFDHALYAQPAPRGLVEAHRWQESARLASSSVALGKCQGLVDGKGHVYRRLIAGMQKNQDVIVAA